MDIADNLAQVKLSIAQAAHEAGRNAKDIDLVAVSKVHDIDRIRPALVAGHRIFAENRVQEAQTKWPALKEDFPDTVLHLIGSLQTNKVREAVALFDVIETVDRPKLARALSEEMKKQDRGLGIYIQVNTGEETQKGGCLPEDIEEMVTLCRTELGLNVLGLMCIPPANEEPSLHFAFLREQARKHDLEKLSMGMSSDFEVAVRFEATSVRVGTAIFGQRPARK